ncbi:MAG: T9SS type A sorting domain-containing protein, partial [Calditrichaceae bacterium]
LNDTIYSSIDSLYLSPDSTNEYTLIAMGNEYADTVKFKITVLQLGSIEYFYSDKLTIEPGDSTLLKWRVVGGDCCSYVTLNGDSVGGFDSLYVSPLSDSIFTLATDGPAPDTSTVTIIVEESFTYFEAENAVTTGQATKVNSGAASGGAYMDLKDAWTITWKNIFVPDSGEYILRVGYQLTYDSPKSQYLVVNSDTLEIVEFTAPNTSIWLSKDISIPLVQGLNTIAFHGFWNWMSLDYIALQGATIVTIKERDKIPTNPELSQNYPNPFNPSTTIEFNLDKNQKVKITIYNSLGRKVKTLYNGIANIGLNSIQWNSTNESGVKVSSGIYYYRLQVKNNCKTKKMILIK